VKNPAKERRDTARILLRGCRAAWATRAGERLWPASLLDVSDAGVGLLVDSANRPEQGEPIRLLSRQSPHARRARVVRVCGAANGTSRIGCEWHSPGLNPGPRSLRTARS
jgi:hypothetical protein